MTVAAWSISPRLPRLRWGSAWSMRAFSRRHRMGIAITVLAVYQFWGSSPVLKGPQAMPKVHAMPVAGHAGDRMQPLVHQS